jgi:hypothetical protein
MIAMQYYHIHNIRIFRRTGYDWNSVRDIPNFYFEEQIGYSMLKKTEKVIMTKHIFYKNSNVSVWWEQSDLKVSCEK